MTGKQLGMSSRPRLLLVLAGILSLGMAARLVELPPIPASPDERNYTEQAALVLQLGRSAIPVMVANFRADPGLPPPTRAGYLYALAGVMRLTGRQDRMAAIWMSMAASLISLLLVGRIAWRFLTPAEALVGVSLYAASPLTLMTAHRGWEEAFAEMLALVLLLSATEIATGNREWAWMVLFCVTGAVCLTVKEVTILVFLLLTAALAWTLLRQQNQRQALAFGGIWVVAVAAAVGWMTWLLRDVTLLWKMPEGTAAFLATSPYSLTHENGTGLDLVRGFWIVSPLAAIGFPLGMAAAWRRETNRVAVLGWVALTLLFLGLVLVTPHHLNFRFLSVVYGPFYLLAGAGLVDTAALGLRRLGEMERRWVVAGLAMVVGLSAVSDYATFRQQFLVSRLSDLSIRVVETGNDK